MNRANGLFPDCHPGHGLADVWAAPDHAGLAEGLSQAVGVVHVGGPEAPPLIEALAEGSGLNCVVEHQGRSSEYVDTVGAEEFGLGLLPSGLERGQISGRGVAPALPDPGVGLRSVAVLSAEHLSDRAEESGVEVGHLVDFVSTNIGPRATHVQGQCATASPGYDSGVSRFRAVLRKRPGGSQRGVRLVYPSPGGHRVRQPPTRAGTFLTGCLSTPQIHGSLYTRHRVSRRVLHECFLIL